MNLKENKDRKPMEVILEEISCMTEVSKDLILSRTRKQEVADARMLFCYITRKEGYPICEIATFIKRTYSRVSMAYYDVKLRKDKFRPLIGRLTGYGTGGV